jgi:hypothetical protein
MMDKDNETMAPRAQRPGPDSPPPERTSHGNASHRTRVAKSGTALCAVPVAPCAQVRPFRRRVGNSSAAL